jgi:hypothetical protein
MYGGSSLDQRMDWTGLRQSFELLEQIVRLERNRLRAIGQLATPQLHIQPRTGVARSQAAASVEAGTIPHFAD